VPRRRPSLTVDLDDQVANREFGQLVVIVPEEHVERVRL
jgi:hypothetical protein